MKIKQKFLSVLLTICLVLPLVPTVAFAAEEGTTPENPILIYSAEDLEKIDQGEQYLYAKLMTNIDLASAPVAGTVDGWWNARIMNFRGELDGNGHTIRNTTAGNAFIGYFHEGVLKNFIWELSAWSSLVAYQVTNEENSYFHTYADITAVGNVEWTTDNNNESVFVTYASGDTTFEDVTLNMDMTTGVSYNGLFIGYEPFKESDYVFTDCTVIGNYRFEDVGVLFGNGSKSGDYGLQHVLGDGVEQTSTITVNNMNITGATIEGLRSPARLLCGVSYNETTMDGLENQLKEKVIGYENLKKAQPVSGITATLNADNQVKIKAENSNALENIGSFEVISEVYAHTYENGVSNGTQKFSVSDKINVQDGVTDYYSLLGKVSFYDDSSDGTMVTTGLNGGLSQVEVGGVKYYTIPGQQGNKVYTFGNTAEPAGISRLSSVKIAVYDKQGLLSSMIYVTTGTDSFAITQPAFANTDEVLYVGEALSQHGLADGWAWAAPDTRIVEGGQWAFAVKGTEMVPVEFTGVSVAAESVAIGGGDFTLQIGHSKQMTATVSPENTTHKTVAWTSSNESVATVDETGRVIALAEGRATITATVGAVTDTCVVTVTPTIATLPTIDLSEPVEEVAVGVDSEDAATVEDTMEKILVDIATGSETTGVSASTVASIEQAVAEGKIISTEIVATPVTDVTPAEQAAISSVLEADEQIAQYLNLQVLVKADGITIGTINELNNEITFTVAIPENLKAEGRTFFVVRLHNGIAERLNTTMNPDGTLSFSTDKFSTYALAYEDKAATQPVNPGDDGVKNPTGTPTTNPPQTGDNSNLVLPIILLLVSVVGFAGLFVCLQKRKYSK